VTLGVRAGDRVATLLNNGPMAAVLPHAILRLGATLVPLNVRLSEPELARLIGDAKPRVMIVEGRTAALLAQARREHADLAIPSIDAAGADALGGSVALDRMHEGETPLRLVHDGAHVLAIVYTSGTTDAPKGAMLTVANYWWSAIGSALNLGTGGDDRWLCCLPLFHVGGLSILFRAAIYGITAIVHDGFDEVAVNRAIDDDGVTIVSVVATMLQRMLDARSDRPYPPSLRCVLLGGGPAPRALLERCAALSIPVVQTYGLTETTSQIATLAPEDALAKLGSAGRPLYPNELRVVSPDGDDIGPDGEGEIIVRGPVVMAGYFGRADPTARAMVNGWLHTGDIGRIDREGYLYVLDRRDDLIITGGENVHPAEVEAVLLAHPWVSEAGVIGVADEAWGQRVVAFVCLASGAGAGGVAEELRAYCLSRLGKYKVPSEIRVVREALPRTASGKVRRADLRARVSGN
jgi:O-succinylbenzoic acid--CoA ligase